MLPHGAVSNEGWKEGKKMRGEQTEIHLFLLLKIELCSAFLHHKITQNIDLCLLFQEEMLGLCLRSTITAGVAKSVRGTSRGGDAAWLLAVPCVAVATVPKSHTRTCPVPEHGDIRVQPRSPLHGTNQSGPWQVAPPAEAAPEPAAFIP